MRNWSKISHFAKMVKLYFVYFDKFSQKIAFNFKFRFFPFLFRIFSLKRLKWNFAKKKLAFFGSEMRKNGKISRNKKCKNRNSKTNAIILRKFIKIDKIQFHHFREMRNFASISHFSLIQFRENFRIFNETFSSLQTLAYSKVYN